MTDKQKEGWRAFTRTWISPIVTIITGCMVAWQVSHSAVIASYGLYVNGRVLIDSIHYSTYHISIIEKDVAKLKIDRHIDSTKLERLIAKQP